MASSLEDTCDPAATLDESCARAMGHQLAGALDLAAQSYRAILQAAPQHAAANHCLGMLLVQSQRPAEGLPYLIAALAVDPQVADYWLGYLEALLLAGRTGEARDTLALARQHGLQGRSVEEFAARLNGKLLPLPAAGNLDPANQRRANRTAARLETKALAQLKARNFAAAQISARTLTRQFPERGIGWKILGRCWRRTGMRMRPWWRCRKRPGCCPRTRKPFAISAPCSPSWSDSRRPERF